MAMRFEHEFTVPVPVEQAWPTLLDVERVGPCLPGASVESVEGEEVTGRMKVKVGPITVTYRGTAVFEEVDKDARTVSIRAAGKEVRGTGTTNATIRARLHPEGDATKVTVETSFNVTGRPAQFGRGVMAEVAGKLIGRFSANLSDLLSAHPDLPAHAEPSGGAGRVPPPAVVPAPERDEAAGRDEAERDAGKAAGPEPGRPAESRHLSAVPAEPRHTGVREEAAHAAPARVDTVPTGTARTSRTPEEEALDLLEIAGSPLLKRLAPVAGLLAVLLAVAWVVRRALRHR
ncbi:carbon monoxide dehydrogenase subunit G [Microtetraspora sp. NBRC 13810]|uniref:SRPBCC family protein n=1 Tax=Microtetraspora sp. NBRC 13810 TaxID=3030990 RepID=UPI0024A50EB5|nr:SRPBCC family protein [Microtetraspora sp. NBRC 13810]GLW05525.1 carbon monoxide dehydrogenase subunit G [Microtetraspora sp. NBRC 13810]